MSSIVIWGDRNGSLWHWPLTALTFPRGRRIELKGAPFYWHQNLSKEEEDGWSVNPAGDKGERGWCCSTTFCLPQEELVFFVFNTQRTSLSESFCFPRLSRSASLNKRDSTCGLNDSFSVSWDQFIALFFFIYFILFYFLNGLFCVISQSREVNLVPQFNVCLFYYVFHTWLLTTGIQQS